ARGAARAVARPAGSAAGALGAGGEAARSPARPAVAAVAPEPPPVGGDDGAAIHQRAVVLLVSQPAPPLADAAGIRAQRELLDQQRKPRLGELGRLIARVRHDVDGGASVGIVSTARTPPHPPAPSDP